MKIKIHLTPTLSGSDIVYATGRLWPVSKASKIYISQGRIKATVIRNFMLIYENRPSKMKLFWYYRIFS